MAVFNLAAVPVTQVPLGLGAGAMYESKREGAGQPKLAIAVEVPSFESESRHSEDA